METVGRGYYGIDKRNNNKEEGVISRPITAHLLALLS
jgi:hypothetical protein